MIFLSLGRWTITNIF